jgi:hypothetical protein
MADEATPVKRKRGRPRVHPEKPVVFGPKNRVGRPRKLPRVGPSAPAAAPAPAAAAAVESISIAALPQSRPVPQVLDPQRKKQGRPRNNNPPPAPSSVLVKAAANDSDDGLAGKDYRLPAMQPGKSSGNLASSRAGKVASTMDRNAQVKLMLRPTESWRDTSFFEDVAVGSPACPVTALEQWAQEVANPPPMHSVRLQIKNSATKINLDAERSIPPYEGVFTNRKSDEDSDVMLNGGGAILAVEALKSQAALGKTLLAVGVQDRLEDACVIGKACAGPNLLQIWSLSLHPELVMPSMAYAIAHEGGRVLSLSWAPDTPSAMSGVVSHPHLLGILAATCGDGRVRIYACPTWASTGRELPSKAVIKLAPVAEACMPKTLLTSGQWNPRDPSMLLTSACNGTATTWRLITEPGKASRCIALQQYMDASLSIPGDPGRTAMWTASCCPQDGEYFATSGECGGGIIWNLRDSNYAFRQPQFSTRDKGRSKVALGPSVSQVWCPLGSAIWSTYCGCDTVILRHEVTGSASKPLGLPRPLKDVPEDMTWSVDAVCIEDAGRTKHACLAFALPDGTVRVYIFRGTKHGALNNKKQAVFAVVQELSHSHERGRERLACDVGVRYGSSWQPRDASAMRHLSTSHRVVRFHQLSTEPRAPTALITGGYCGIVRILLIDETIRKLMGS